MGDAEGSIMAVIITLHMMNTAAQLAGDHAEMGIISCAAGCQNLSRQFRGGGVAIGAGVDNGAAINSWRALNVF
jgi:hypothetical protein